MVSFTFLIRIVVWMTFFLVAATNAWVEPPATKILPFPDMNRHRSLRQLVVVQQFSPLFYGNEGGITEDNKNNFAPKVSTVSDSSTFSASFSPSDRFQRQASNVQGIDRPCILSIDGKQYNMTAWANSHPGGSNILQKFHNKDATDAFAAAHHSDHAHVMLSDFLVVGEEGYVLDSNTSSTQQRTTTPVVSTRAIMSQPRRQRLRQKLFTKEDPIGIHKYLGLFCLLNFLARYTQMYFGDPAAGLGSRGHPWFSMLCLFPHALLSLSSLIFHTVPKERVVGRPMIWQEYRIHNIVFGVRSVLTAWIASLAIKSGNTSSIRMKAIVASGVCVLLANWGADQATEQLRVVQVESTTATMPYWEGCSVATQKRFKCFYAYCQFMATLACLAVANPAWPLAVLIAIQIASLLMTLVRKGILSVRGYHYGYTASLVMPYFVGFRSMLYTKTYEFPIMLILGYALYQLRRRGVSKYFLWIPVILGRLLVGDKFINYSAS